MDDGECSPSIAGGEPTPQSAESFLHTFFNCPYSGRYRTAAFTSSFPESLASNDDIQKRFWFFREIVDTGNTRNNLFIESDENICNFLIWEIKLKKGIKPILVFIEELNYCLLKSYVPVLKYGMQKLELTLLFAGMSSDRPDDILDEGSEMSDSSGTETDTADPRDRRQARRDRRERLRIANTALNEDILNSEEEGGEARLFRGELANTDSNVADVVMADAPPAAAVLTEPSLPAQLTATPAHGGGSPDLVPPIASNAVKKTNNCNIAADNSNVVKITIVQAKQPANPSGAGLLNKNTVSSNPSGEP